MYIHSIVWMKMSFRNKTINDIIIFTDVIRRSTAIDNVTQELECSLKNKMKREWFK